MYFKKVQTYSAHTTIVHLIIHFFRIVSKIINIIHISIKIWDSFNKFFIFRKVISPLKIFSYIKQPGAGDPRFQRQRQRLIQRICPQPREKFSLIKYSGERAKHLC